MRVDLAYGSGVLPVEFARGVDVIEPADAPALGDVDAALSEALRHPTEAPPLRQIAGSGDQVVVVISDSTRPAPNRQMVRSVLQEIAHVPEDRITLMVATGLHRPTRTDELELMLGADILGRYQVVNHDAHNPSGLCDLGTTATGRPVIISRRYLDADVRITLGLIEPHFFAGFSGGAKLIMPGVAGEATIMRNHDAEMIGQPQARWGVVEGNPILSEQREAARMAGCEFILNVTINKERAITGVYAGALEPAHDAGCAAAVKTSMRAVEAPYDVVVTTNGGFPLDQNLYQAVKGMDAAALIVRGSGQIVMAAECREGAGHGEFVKILDEHADPTGMLRGIHACPGVRADQWQNQIFGRVLEHARVHLYTDGLTSDEIRAAFCEPCADVSARVAELADDGARVCVLPRGPETIPYLAAA